MRRHQLSRRHFLASCAAGLSVAPDVLRAQTRAGARPTRTEDGDGEGDDWFNARIARMGGSLRDRFGDLHRHFVFEYYPWYDTEPWRHWDGAGRTPPAQIAAPSYPWLGAYNSRAARTLEQHAHWIKDAGVGTINLSWWGRGSYEDESTHVVMDVMRAFDIKVTFHLEPYSPERGARFADDVLYILREYGERRRWDTLLLLEDARGNAAPIFKSFVTLLSPTTTNCVGVTSPVDIYVPDDLWRQHLARLRREVAVDFDRITFVADSLDAPRTAATGFDAGSVGNPYIRPNEWASYTDAFDRSGVPFAFAVHAGFETIELTPPPPDPCYRPDPFEPDPTVDWNEETSRELAHQLCAARIRSSFERTLAHQTDPRSANWRRGFFLVPINSFNEWHEGTQFEPMASYRDLSPSDRLLYHNAVNGSYRLEVLRSLMGLVL